MNPTHINTKQTQIPNRYSMHACTKCTHARTHTHAHTHAQMYTRTQTHTHTQGDSSDQPLGGTARTG